MNLVKLEAIVEALRQDPQPTLSSIGRKYEVCYRTIQTVARLNEITLHTKDRHKMNSQKTTEATPQILALAVAVPRVSIAQISKVTGLSGMTVAKVIAKNGVTRTAAIKPPKPEKPKTEPKKKGRPCLQIDIDEMAGMYINRVPLKQIAAYFGCSLPTVKNKLRSAGVIPHNKEESE